MTSNVIGMLVVSIIAQVVGASLLPLTRGLTQPLPTLGLVVAFAVGIGLLARISHAGVNLGLLIPITSAAVPLCAIAAGIFFYGEPFSLGRIATLAIACVLIGVSNVI